VAISRRFIGIVLVVIGVLFLALVLLAAFTIYGEIAGVLGLACVACGAILLGRSAAAPPGWWQASDGRWYPPETRPDYRPPPANPSEHG
jgi:hypothetical protein